MFQSSISEQAPVIRFDQVAKSYPNGADALKRSSFSLAPQSLTFLLGHSGAGKSTLIKLLLMLEKPTHGQIWVDGQSLSKVKRAHIPFYRRNLGVVFQHHKLIEDLSTFDNVALPLKVAGVDLREVKRRTCAALDKVDLLKKGKFMPSKLSGGEQQRVGIARAIVNKPKILLADEPTGNLDPELSESIMKLFDQFRMVGTTVLIATHDIPLVEKLGHDQLILQDGHIVAHHTHNESTLSEAEKAQAQADKHKKVLEEAYEF